MIGKILLFVSLLCPTGTVFSKGHPPTLGVSYNGTGVAYCGGGVCNSDTVVIEITAGDSCLLSASGASGYPMKSMDISCNGVSVYSSTSHFLCFVKQPGIYEFWADNDFDIMPYSLLVFEIRYKPAVTSVPEKPRFEFAVFPNPTSGDVFIRAGNDGFNGRLSVTDLNGKHVWNGVVSGLGPNDQYYVPSSGWQPGVYVLEIANATGVQRYRIVRN